MSHSRLSIAVVVEEVESRSCNVWSAAQRQRFGGASFRPFMVTFLPLMPLNSLEVFLPHLVRLPRFKETRHDFPFLALGPVIRSYTGHLQHQRYQPLTPFLPALFFPSTLNSLLLVHLQKKRRKNRIEEEVRKKSKQEKNGLRVLRRDERREINEERNRRAIEG